MADRSRYRVLEQWMPPQRWQAAGVAFEHGEAVSLWLPVWREARVLFRVTRLEDLSEAQLPFRGAGWRWSEQMQESWQEPLVPLDAFRLSQPAADLASPARFLE